MSHGGNRSFEARRLGLPIDEVLDASSSVVPFELPQQIMKCLLGALHGHILRDYPDTTHECFRQLVGQWHGVDSGMVLPGNGAAELFTWAARDSVAYGMSLLPSPGFNDYLRALKCWQANYTLESLPLSWSSAQPQPFPLQPEVDVMWITNPHNPTGQLWSRNSLETFLKDGRLVICDEAFLPLVPDGDRQSLIPLVPKHPNLVVIRSLTKLFGIAGLRLGYAISCSDRLKLWREWRDPWPVNGLALEAGMMIMKDFPALENWITRVQKWVSVEGSWFYNQLQNLPTLEVYPSAANYFLVRGNASLLPLRENLAQSGILLRECTSFKGLGEQWLRISLQDRSGNIRILESLRRSLK